MYSYRTYDMYALMYYGGYGRKFRLSITSQYGPVSSACLLRSLGQALPDRLTTK
jgi:hypothetical protein